MNPVVVAGALANKPLNGGEAWVRLSWVRGLERLGVPVHFLEVVDPSGVGGMDASGTAYFRSVTEEFGLSGRATLVKGDRTVVGLAPDELADLAEAAPLLVNISGNLPPGPLRERFRTRAYVDLDPGYTQVWLAQGTDRERVLGHHAYFTVAARLGRPDCPIPTGGIDWLPLPPPVVLDDWPVTDGADNGRFTTVASWRGAFGPVSHGGRRYGAKAHEMRRFLGVPAGSGRAYEILLQIHPADDVDRIALERAGWTVLDPCRRVPGPHDFRRYVQGSFAEFSVAQGVYVHTRSGWFSDRSVRYLASGRPVLLQDTGFGETLPAGEGLVGFTSPDEAIAGARRIAEDYPAHRQAARHLAEAHFASDVVLSRFLERSGLRA